MIRVILKCKIRPISTSMKIQLQTDPICSDHSPLLVECGGTRRYTPRRFKFLNCVVEHDDFLPSVQRGWDTYISGFMMYQVWMKLKQVRNQLMHLTRYYSKDQIRVLEFEHKLILGKLISKLILSTISYFLSYLGLKKIMISGSKLKSRFYTSEVKNSLAPMWRWK